MQRYFVPRHDWNHNMINIHKQEDIHHIKNVMRMHIGTEIICINDEGQSVQCKITNITNQVVELEIMKFLNEDRELPVQVTIAQGLPKKNKLEFILQKGTELGCTQFCLFEADRSIVEWNNKKAKQKMERYRKIVQEASEQCERNKIPNIHAPVSLENVLRNHSNYDIMLFAYEDEARSKQFNSFSHILEHVKSGERILIWIGPEGGFSKREIKLLIELNAVPVRLGPRILRTETASMYALASISYHFEELRCKR